MIYDTILVTGAAGDIGQSIAEIIRSSGAAAKIIGVDMIREHGGAVLFDKLDQVEPVESRKFQASLSAVIRKTRPDIIVPTVEVELNELCESALLSSFDGIPVLAANSLAVRIGLDKLATMRHLEIAGIEVPWTRVIGVHKPDRLPCIVKQRRGQGSKGLAVAEEANLSWLERTRQGDLWQQLLPDADEEYTCGLYKPADTPLRTIIFRRELQGSFTGRAELVRSEVIEDVLHRVAEALNLRGAVNVQLRMDAGRPMIFEINPRFSSTVGFRHRVGFRDLIWALLETRGLRIEDFDPPPAKMTFFRMSRIVRGTHSSV